MSTTGLEVFDKTLHATHIWLDEIIGDLGPDMRDRLPVDLAAHLGAQMPLLVRGPYYDPFEPSRLSSQVDSAEDFTGRVSTLLADSRAVSPEAACGFWSDVSPPQRRSAGESWPYPASRHHCALA
jgi:hypothetical protein